MITFEDVAARLALLGYTVTEDDRGGVEFSIARATERLKATLNLAEIPDGLFYTHIDVAAGLYLQDKRAAASGESTGGGTTAPIKSIAEGDVKIEYATESASNSEALIARLVTIPPDILAKYRRLAW